MITYETFFIIILISILGPIISLLAFIFQQMQERKVYLLEIQNRQILLEKELEISKYNQLNQQIQPHFLFNALNSLLSLIRLKKYDRLVESFEHMVLFLRSKYNLTEQFQPLVDEISHTKHYLAIQQLRYGERLKVTWNIANDLETENIIPFLIQTLVENAFKHGLELIEGEALLSISIVREGANILLEVRDNGPGLGQSGQAHEGLGLSNIRERLLLIYGEQAEMNMYNNEQISGAIITVTWPVGYKWKETARHDFNGYVLRTQTPHC